MNEFQIVKHYLTGVWPEAIFEDADGMIVVSLRDQATSTREFFVYENTAAYESWTENGACDENAGQMIHFVVGAHELTCVVAEQESAQSRGFVDEIRGAILSRMRRPAP